MPQLDFTVSLPQIFWLIVIFFSVYTLLTHFFLPSFVKLVKSRKVIVQINDEELSSIQSKVIFKQLRTKKIIHKNFVELKIMLEKDFSGFLKNYTLLNLPSLDKKLALVLHYNIIYYNPVILNLIPLKPNL